MAEPRVLIVVPTLGQRLDYLDACLQSIRDQDVPCDITIVGPQTTAVQEAAEKHGADLIEDPGSLTAAINLGISRAKPHHEYVNWLGDDDLLTPRSLARTTEALDAHPQAVVAYGACSYIDAHDKELWVSKAGPWAARILNWGPDLIPQPGMLVRQEAWNAVGGLDESYQLAFDLDLLLKLKKIGTLIPVDHVVSCFRWHADSMTVGDRSLNIAESERAKRQALSRPARSVAWLWEKPVALATTAAAASVQRRARRLTQGA